MGRWDTDIPRGERLFAGPYPRKPAAGTDAYYRAPEKPRVPSTTEVFIRTCVARTAISAASTGLTASAFKLAPSARPVVSMALGVMPLAVGIAGAAILACVIGSQFDASVASTRHITWASSVALGVLVAPVCVAGTPWATGLATLILATSIQVGLCAIASRAWQPQPSFKAPCAGASTALTALACTTAVSLGARASAACALVVGAYTTMAGTVIVGAFYGAHLLSARAYVKSLKVDEATTAKMRLEHLADDPTILQPPEALCETLKKARLVTPEQGQVPVYVLEGPAGTGKSVMAQGIAQALDATLVRTTANQLRIDDIPFVPVDLLNCIALLAQADMEAETTKRRVVVVIDEAETLLSLPLDTPTAATMQRYLGTCLLYMAVATGRLTGSRVSLVLVTNYVDKMRDVLTNLEATIFSVPDLTAKTRQRLAALAIRSLETQLAQRHPTFDLTRAPDFQRFNALLDEHTFHGRDIAGAIASIKRHIDAASLDKPPEDIVRLTAEAMQAACAFLESRRQEPFVDAPIDNSRPGFEAPDMTTMEKFFEGCDPGTMLQDVMQGVLRMQTDPAKRLIAANVIQRYTDAHNYLMSRLMTRGKTVDGTTIVDV